MGDIVYLDDRAHQITELWMRLQLLPTGMSYPIYRAESREQFEQLCGQTNATAFIRKSCRLTPTKPIRIMWDVLSHGLIIGAGKQSFPNCFVPARPTARLPLWLSRAYPNIVETMELETGDTADYRTTPEGIELEVLGADEKRLAMLSFR